MKTKKIKRKLFLNKISIANLGNEKIGMVKDDLPAIKGGSEEPNACSYTCDGGPDCLESAQGQLLPY